ncbi:MAG: SMP-30/gluconolactonase/LRE family protein [Blastocatellia bacterium]|nr:SMP-30/gluconolactonase/LRE family protein [Blastocatellia bacterium]
MWGRIGKTRGLVCFCVIWMLGVLPERGFGQDAEPFYVQAEKAYQAREYEKYRELLRAGIEQGMAGPPTLFRLAGAYALTGHTTQALETLETLAKMGLAFQVQSNADFARIKDHPDFKRIAAQLERNQTPQGRAVPAFTLRDRELIPEGIAYDPHSRTFFVGSLKQRKIIAINAKGKERDFATSGQDGLWDVVGMTVDAQRRALWVCSVAYYGGGPETGATGIFQYDLKQGRLARKYVLPGKPNEHGFNDLTVAANGDVFITDSSGNGVYWISHETDRLEPFFSTPEFFFPNGIAVSADQKRIYVASNQGIFVVERETKKHTRLGCPVEVTTAGIDGLYSVGQTLVAVQNGVEPERVVRFFLNPAGTAVRRMETLVSHHPQFAIPTTAVVSGSQLYFFANTQLNRLQSDGTVKDPETLKPVVILKTRL